MASTRARRPSRVRTATAAGGVVLRGSGDVAEVVQLVGIYEYGIQGRRFIVGKAVAYKPGQSTVTMYPPADPDADPTLVLDAEPASFVVRTRE